MNSIYLDNAATTLIAQEVIALMHREMQEVYGNPSSTHQFGRLAKTKVETARKNIAKHFNISASELVFTAGGTEADNLILYNAVLNLGVQHFITSKIEHHAVLHTIQAIEQQYAISVSYVDVNADGTIDLAHLSSLLQNSDTKTLVSLMHINNEIGTILPLAQVWDLCATHKALFHSDTVQTIGHYHLDLQQTPVDFITASAHKFHGPKGVGFAYFKKGFGIMPMLHGGDQERGARSSTENVHSILGMEKALALAFETLEEDKTQMNGLKQSFINSLQEAFQGVQFNGNSANLSESSCTILNVRFPISNEMLLFSLDLAGIAVSGGSACQSGSNQGSHVLNALLDDTEAQKTSIRFSFSRYTTLEEIESCVLTLKELLV